MKNIRPLRTPADHQWALKEVERYFKKPPAPGSEEGDRFDVLSALIEHYENEHVAIPAADPIDVLHFALDSMDKTQADLARILGSASRASEILNRKRRLTLDMIRRISEDWNLPIESLTGDYELARNTG
ncbi:XRE family transcriptional regulator [Bradyrhizobium prioriisuperbiae]|uniref:helix-turn-helix domain-containing protein n=1 Tax=Bradyrhizobium prioriisuperbiae TaxID=2854389 RepID=UPI0028EA6BFC|nr:XRE family transcriptional regulator [Bradyrhizobium prioritasuperba]